MPPLLCWVAHNDAIRRHKDSAFAEEDNQGFVPLSSDSRSRSGQNLRKQQDLPIASCRLELTGWKMEYCGPSSSRKSGATAGPVVLFATVSGDMTSLHLIHLMFEMTPVESAAGGKSQRSQASRAEAQSGSQGSPRAEDPGGLHQDIYII